MRPPLAPSLPERDSPATIRRLLGRARRRLRARRALESAAATLPWALAAAAAIVLAQRLLALRVALPLATSDLALLAFAGVGAALAMAAAHGALSAPSDDVGIALLVDRGLDLDERLTAAVALRAADDAPEWELRATRALGRRDVRDALPMRPLPWRAAAVLAVALGAAFFTPPLPAASRRQPAQDPTVVAAAQQVKAQAAKAEEQLPQGDEAQEARRVLAEIKKAAERAQVQQMTKEEALAELQRIDETARKAQQQREAADAGAMQRALSSLEQALAQREAMRHADDAEAQSLEKQLQQLANELSQGTSYEKRDAQRMAARLRDAADALAETHPELSEKLKQLAEALEKGDTQAAEKLARELAASPEMQQLAGQGQSDQALEDARRMLQQAMAQLGKAPTDAEAEDMRLGEADPASEDGSQQGRVPRDRSGKAGVQQDWGVGTTHEAAAEFDLDRRGLQQDRQSKETSDWREAYEAAHDSTHLQDAKARSTRVHGALGEGELVAVDTRQVSRSPETATVGAVRVPADYARANEEAMAREEVPAPYRDAVRKYFTSLDETRAAPAAASAPAPVPQAPPKG